MKICLNCQTKNEDDSRFCHNCGFRLPEEGADQAVGKQGTVVAPPPFLAEEEAAPITNDMPEDEIQARVDEAMEAKKQEAYPPTEIAPEQPSARPISTDKPAAPGTVVVNPPASSLSFTLQFASGATVVLTGSKEYFVGRTDPANNWYPAVDLAPHGGEKGGASRRHARFFVQEGKLFLDDLGSTNGSFINNQRLTPGQPKVVNHGDSLLFGRILVNCRET